MVDDAIYQKIFESMREGVMTVDLKGIITTFNPAAEQILGLPRGQVLGQVLATVFFEIEGTDELIEAILAAVYESDTTHQQLLSFPTATGTKRLAVTTSFLHHVDAAGQPVRAGVVTVFSDVTEVELLRERAHALQAVRVEGLARAYRERGHVLAEIDPLGLRKAAPHPELTAKHHGLEEDDPNALLPFVENGEPVKRSLGHIHRHLQAAYCGPVGIQYTHIDDQEIQAWLRERLEGTDYDRPLPRDTQLHILRKLTDAKVFETFVQSTFKRSKRFSLEGAETLIPLLDQAIEQAAGHGVDKIVIGMSHRGRLNVLVNLLGVPASKVFRRFQQLESGVGDEGNGDVPFHLGAETTRSTAAGQQVHLSLCFNPSHLELVGPVVLGRVRARQESARAEPDGAVLPLVVHGDAAFAGQGIVQEMFNMSRLPAYTTGGAVHVVLNNQIGFTTSPAQGRSTQYATDVARMLQIPIFHVNGERPEAVDRVIRLALDFWQRWRRDVVVDMYCYRRHGHMELDEPLFTQPVLYRAIQDRPSILETFAMNLVGLGQVTEAEAGEIEGQSRDALNRELARTSEQAALAGHGDASSPTGNREKQIATAVADDELRSLLERLSSLPPKFQCHAKVGAVLRRRLALSEGRGVVDWATAEALAFASLLAQGCSVRLTGQDTERGTFAHRHAVLHDMLTGDTLTPLAACAAKGGELTISNSPLSEAAVLAFEFGYSLDATDHLVIWEAQFGDFANMAQAVIDQFVVSSEEKWGQQSRLTLLLPHGFDGQGPEHSSARIERFLQLCACHNIEVVQPTTASQIFHRLRQQALSPVRRPLVVLTPKRLLQLRAAASPLSALGSGAFEPLLVDRPEGGTRRVLICGGQLAPELTKQRNDRGSPFTIARLEQLYPLPVAPLAELLGDEDESIPVVWVQEEPRNMGAWRWLHPQLTRLAGRRDISCVSRPEQPSPATGNLALHQRQQQALIDAALDNCPVQ